MRVRMLVIASIQCGVLLHGSLCAAQAEDKVKKDRRRMATSAGVMAASVGVTAAGVVTLNPIAVGLGMYGFGAGTGSLGRSAIQHRIHRKQAESDQVAGSAAAVVGPVESLTPIPGRPGYFYYPSNPTQLYFDPAQVSDPMQARIAEEAATASRRITVRIANPSKDGPAIDCQVDGTAFSIPPGMLLSVNTVDGAVISYDRGDSPGVARYRLVEGDYEFRSVENGRRFYTSTPARTVAMGPGGAVPSSTVPAQGPSVPR